MNKAYLLENGGDYSLFGIHPHDTDNWPKEHVEIDWWEPDSKGKIQKNIDLTRHYHDGEKEAKDYPDFWVGVPGWVYVSEEFKKLLVKASTHKKAEEVYEFFTPTFVKLPEKMKRKAYSVVWIKDHLKCLDAARSIYYDEEDLKTPAVRHSAVDGLMHIFHIAEHSTRLCVSRQLAEILRNSGLKGFHLEPIEAA